MSGKFSPGSANPRRNAWRIGASVVSLSTLAWAAQANAETKIDSARTTPIATSTAASGSPDSISITSDGSVKPASGVAVTLDSDNDVANAGTIQIQDADGAVGVLVTGGHTAGVSNSGTIQVDETTEASDADEDGDDDGAFATGAGRYGIRVTGPSAFTGDIVNGSGGAITVEGNDSAGVSVETDLTGSLSNLGGITVVGDRAYGLRSTGEIGGDVAILGYVSATGEAAQGVALEGDIQGGVVVQAAVVSTGYRSTGRSTDADVLAALDADDLLQGGPALAVSGSVAGGLLIDTPPADNDSEDDDEDDDGTADASESTGSVASYGGAPAVVVGAADRDISLGAVSTAAPYGVVIEGSVTGSGVYDGVAATGLQLGLENGWRVDIAGGVTVGGAVGAVAYEADATAMVLNGGASAPLLRVDGSVTASVTSETGSTARAILLQPGATAAALQNAGSITAILYGEAGDAVALQDRSGSLTEIQNIGAIGASIVATDDSDDADDDTDTTNETVTGRAVAIDVSANITGVTVLQYDESGGETPPSIVGDILFGSGDDHLRVLGGVVTGDISFGGGADALTIDGGATVAGRLGLDGGSLALSIADGSLAIENVGVLHLSSLILGAEAELAFTVDPATGTYTALQVAGTAAIANGAQIDLKLTSLLRGEATYTLIRADSLAAGGVDGGLLGDLPYLYASQLAADTDAGTVSVTLSRKTAGQLGLAAAAQGAYEPLIGVIGADSELEKVLLAQTDRESFLHLYNQMLPNRSGSVFRLAAAASAAAARPIDDRLAPEGGGVWIQEINYGLNVDGTLEAPGYKGWGFGFVGGAELPATSLGVAGLTLGGTSSELDDDGATVGESLVMNQVEGGAYWRMARGAFFANARVAVDYVSVKSERVIIGVTDDLQISRTAKADWSGLGLAARLRAGFQLDWGGRFYVRPEAGLDYFRLREGAYEEAGGGEAVDLAVEARTSSSLSGFAGAAFGAAFGEEVTWGPELLLGWRGVASESLGDTNARFRSGGDAFRLMADEMEGQGPAARLSFKGEGDMGAFVLDGGVETRGDLAIYDIRLSAHFRF
ncbi:autotransporter domain-containing protein [Phenylobacterium sp.]|uniref:autotransporter family protein n=1 Tax=Phenylobacterium sp. TaxID=1871053 RepID=UPI00391CC7DA